ncbi:mitochondrial 37S ribosomal protein uS11m MRPS18 KNAG_0K02430 [Huiozyma naganishii CBS 8797]|uniref:Small ribosomal subunit protein uS11m n=1 Tax=Huiozyma naganishii (strain ATCC MYA-139 / BCRC 22969 / CBS 8797 / KCTC 17520 / NBRC 10181 / NCYC 3082 / Yp74L-3) TaxID=1071383 RepID=J7SAZ8_HUIN7|nr:hypothetical protein KNAG_0K02430 [Kazachstania naganishii CBS 8797]CCK72606.1 hypothetical protein KNAG_0K02430 [Kazachstania naganishii CBS 8797]
MLGNLGLQRPQRGFWRCIKRFNSTSPPRPLQVTNSGTTPAPFQFANVRHPQNTDGFSVLKPNEITRSYTLHCLFTKNNTHFTYAATVEDTNYLAMHPDLSYNAKFQYYAKLPSKVKIAISTGCLGFRKAARGEYEAAFQTASKMFKTIQEKNLLNHPIDIVMKDFGKGRAAFIAALNGKEGTFVRPKIRTISDATPLKFGGVRSPRIRRL